MITDCGIYTITSPSGGQYVGSAVSFKNRWARHLRELRRETHHCKPLQLAYKKYGEKALIFRKIFLCKEADLLVYEQHFINKLKPSYNVCPTAGSCLGRKHTEEAKKKLSIGRMGEKNPMFHRPISEETKRRMSQERKTRPPMPTETKQKLSKFFKGKTRSQETVQRMRKGARKGAHHPSAKSVRCIETGQVFSTIAQARDALGVTDSSISKVCRGKLKTTGGYRWEYVT